jgi:Flp pilus assembly protein CpaB
MGSLDLRQLARTIVRALDWHRRLVSAVLAGVAVVAALTVLAPRPPATTAVWAAAHDLGGGAPLLRADLAVAHVPASLLPAGALPATTRVAGRLLAAPVRRGEPLTDVRLLEPPLLSALGRPGDVAVPVRLADGAAAAALVHPGDVVDVLAAGGLDGGPAATPPRVAAAAVTVLAVPPPAGSGDAGLVVVAATAAQAAELADAATTRRLSLVLRRS